MKVRKKIGRYARSDPDCHGSSRRIWHCRRSRHGVIAADAADGGTHLGRRPVQRQVVQPVAAVRTGARHEGVEGRGAQGRPQLRARDDGDPHSRADPRQAGRGRRGAEPLAEARHPRRHLRRPPCDGEPAVRVARQGHLRQRDLDRSRAHAAPPHRRHDRLGQVGLHQHDPHLDAPALDAGRRADDPHRPEADRARLLRVDPAPPDAGRLEPEGSRGRAHERRRRDGAPLRAALVRPRSQPARGEPRIPRARRGRRSRTSSSSSTSSPT